MVSIPTDPSDMTGTPSGEEAKMFATARSDVAPPRWMALPLSVLELPTNVLPSTAIRAGATRVIAPPSSAAWFSTNRLPATSPRGTAAR